MKKSLSKVLHDQRMGNIQPSWREPHFVSKWEFIDEFLHHFGANGVCFPMQGVHDSVVLRGIEIMQKQWNTDYDMSLSDSRFDLNTQIKHLRDIIVEMDGGIYREKDIPDYDDRSYDTCTTVGCGARLPHNYSRTISN